MAFRKGVMPSGERNVIVTLQQRPSTDAVDSGGAPTEVGQWTALVETMPAGKYDLNGSEKYAAEQLSASYNTRFEINYRADMDPDLVDVAKLRRIVFRSKVYDIVASSVIGRRLGIELMAMLSPVQEP